MIFICHMTLQDHVTRALCNFKISHHSTKFCDHRHCDRVDIMVLAYHMISQDHAIKVSCDFMVRILSKYIIILPSLGGIGTLVVEM